MPEINTRLVQQLQFLRELDRLKSIFRQTILLDRSRQENTAEHSWQLATAVVLLQEYASEKIDLPRAMRMALLHDIVEIDAGDTFVYDAQNNTSKAEREQAAASRIFGLLPEDQAAEFRGLWDDFELKKCPESRFVNSLDRLLPVLQNLETDCHTWKKHGIRQSQVLNRNGVIADTSEEIWSHVSLRIEQAVVDGQLLP